MKDLNPASTPHQQMLVALNGGRTAAHIYGGTVPEHVKGRRRAANKVARRSRRINRGQR